MNDRPILKNETLEITTKMKQLSKEVDKYKHATESLSVSNRDALKKIESLNEELVDEEEVKNLLSDKEKVQRELNEIKEHESASHARFLESHHKKEELKKVIEVAQKLIEFLNLESVLKQKAQKEETFRNLKDCQTKLIKLQEDLKELTTDFELQVKATKKKIETKKKKIKTINKKIHGTHKENETQKSVLMLSKEEFEKEKILLEKSKKEMEQVLILGEQTLEFIIKGFVTLNSGSSA